MANSEAIIEAAALWRVRGRRFLQLRQRRHALYQVALDFINHYDVVNGKTKEFHMWRTVLRLRLCQ